ncbi:MAG: iron ABC transporter permease [Acidimicrobiales bacterium]
MAGLTTAHVDHTLSDGVATRAAVARAFRLPGRSLTISLLVLVAAVMVGTLVGPAGLGPKAVVLEFVDKLPFVSAESGLTENQQVILWQWRFSRVVLGGCVGASLAMAGAGYQGVFRNPLADPFLLGAAAGAGLGATLVFAFDLAVGWGPFDSVAVAAFVGALLGVGLSAFLGQSADRSPAGLLLAGVAVASFLTAVQTYVLQRQTDVIRDVYSWIFGRLTTAGWQEPGLLAPYLVVCGGVLFVHRRHLDVLRLGDDEARSLGVQPGRVRLIVVIAASLLTAAAVAVSGLIGFIGVVVPHVVRLLFGSSYRIVVPLSAVLGAAFMVLADVGARTVVSPGELPIGVLTSFVGAPFFALVLRMQRRVNL